MKKTLTIALVLLAATALEAAGNLRPPRSGVGLRVSAFGVPGVLLDPFLYEHPQVSGQAFTFEVRSYGNKGLRSVFSGVFALEYSHLEGSGFWREEQQDVRKEGGGEINQLSLTATVLLHIFPSLPVHPYVGAGIGIGRVSIWSEGVHRDELGTEVRDTYKETMVIPVGHLPVGLIARLSPRFEIRLEGGFKNGFYLGAGVVYTFR
ncbi:MAG: hypothetical protein RB296_07850 [Acidobacteriota bacterium]|jgi:opacity protein-like surface antigen|nr:hypothetical protein [Acidobacteriota bacterium]